MIEILNKLAATSGRNEKIELLCNSLAECPTLIRVMTLALDPLTSFGFKSIPQYTTSDVVAYNIEQALDQIELLIDMHHSQATIDIVTDVLSHMTADDQEVIKRVILKDLKCGVQLSTFNKAVDLYNATHYKPLDCKIHDYPCMLASAYKDKLIDKIFDKNEYAYCQLKCDGMRFNAVVRGTNVTFYGRSGKQLYIEDEDLISEFYAMSGGKNVVYDGELLIDVDDKLNCLDRKTGNGILNRAVRGTITTEQAKRIHAVLWDRLTLDQFESQVCDDVYSVRFDKLKRDYDCTWVNRRIHLVPNWIVNNKQQCVDHFTEMLDLGREGIIVKSPTNKWKDVRATDCVKFKQEKECDLLVIGDVPITNGKPMVGSVMTATSDKKLLVGVGSGFTEQERIDFYPHKLLGKIITIKYNDLIVDKLTGVYSLFLPRFVEVREDKSEADSLQDLING